MPGRWRRRPLSGYHPGVDTSSAAVERLLAEAIGHANEGRASQALACCERAVEAHAPHAGVLQLLAWLRLREGSAGLARQHIAASLALRPDYLPALAIAVDAARAADATGEARALCERLVALAPQRAEGWFQLALLRQDDRDLPGAAAAWHQVLRLQPGHAQAEVNLGIVLQEAGQLDAAMRAYGRAMRLSENTFGRIAHALAATSHGRMWLSLEQLRAELLQA